MGKTSEVISFNLSQMANDIVDKYIFEDEDLIFPLLRDYRGKTTESAIGSKNAMLNAYLKEVIAGCGIEKDISMHCARHSFAVNSLAMGADIYVLSKFLGHTSLATTEIYAKAVDKRKDELTKLWD
jgi:site-specific recombinase XerD